MRVTTSMYYNNLFGQQNNSLENKLFDVNRQISSGIKIKYAQEDVRAFTETMRLDNEIVTLNQIKTSTESGLKVSSQSDTVLNDFSTSLAHMNTLFVNAANGSHNNDSLDAIAKELRGLEDHFKHLANTSINGQYIFAGSAINTKPIADDGTYKGNDFALNSLLGSNVKQQYNISGAELFLGEESGVRREVTTNVVQKNLSQMYPDFTDLDVDGLDRNLTSEDTIRDMMGDLDNEVDDGVLKHHFYVRGVKSDGTSFNEHIKMSDDQSIDSLLNEIGKAFGNTTDADIVNVSMNSQGQIVVE
ncbi:MAG: flagellar biosynthesis protein FlgL, partial [Campylobacterales bacterium]|nr:flagellar biosynthesis protein FlgL [Campylobacterales bacterium]